MLNTDNMNMKELKEIAGSLNVDFRGNISKVNLKKLIDKKLNEKKNNSIISPDTQIKKDGVDPTFNYPGEKGRLGDKDPKYLRWLKQTNPDLFEEKFGDYVRRYNINLDEEVE